MLDVRCHQEWAERHLEGAVHIPLHELLNRLNNVPEGKAWVDTVSAGVASNDFHRPDHGIGRLSRLPAANLSAGIMQR